MDDAIVLIQWVHFAAAMAAFGGAAFCVYAPIGDAAPVAGFDRWLGREIRVAALVAFGAALATVPATAANMAAAPTAAFDPATLGTVMAATQFGRVWRWHLLFSAALVAATLWRPGPRIAAVVLALAAASLASLAWVGHAAMAPGLVGLGHELNQALHLLAAGAWLGGLMPLFVLLRRAAPSGAARAPALIREAVAHFSGMGYVAVALIAITGVVNTLLLVGSFGALFGTAYGRLLTAKIALYLVMVAVAVANRVRLSPRLDRDPGATAALARSIVLEQALGLAILAAASLLGTWPPAAMGHAM